MSDAAPRSTASIRRPLARRLRALLAIVALGLLLLTIASVLNARRVHHIESKLDSEPIAVVTGEEFLACYAELDGRITLDQLTERAAFLTNWRNVFEIQAEVETSTHWLDPAPGPSWGRSLVLRNRAMDPSSRGVLLMVADFRRYEARDQERIDRMFDAERACSERLLAEALAEHAGILGEHEGGPERFADLSAGVWTIPIGEGLRRLYVLGASIVLAALLPTLWFAWRVWTVQRRIRHGLCVRCRYPRPSRPESTCPECGLVHPC